MKIFAYLIAALMVISLVSATNDNGVGNPNEECQDNGFDYGVSKWDCGNDFTLDVSLFNEDDWSTEVTGTCQNASWTASPDVDGVLVKSSTFTETFPGGTSGDNLVGHEVCEMKEDKDNCSGQGKDKVCQLVEVCKYQDISHVTFCGYDGGDGGCTGDDCGNEVPEFSTLTLGIAVLTATMGMVYLRKR